MNGPACPPGGERNKQRSSRRQERGQRSQKEWAGLQSSERRMRLTQHSSDSKVYVHGYCIINMFSFISLIRKSCAWLHPGAVNPKIAGSQKPS